MTMMLTDEDKEDIFETICILLEVYLKLNVVQYIQPNFHETMIKDIETSIQFIFNASLLNIDSSLIRDYIEEGIAIIYRHISPPRSNGDSFIRVKPNVEKLRNKIVYLQNVPQPEQRTQAWYEFRYNHLTASNMWKIFISESTRNQLIYEKCQPLNTDKYNNNVSFESPMHWGQKYEPLSIMLYEAIYSSKVSDFGCIPHKTIDCIAASPDGIVTDESSLRYGRMLEVKNIVNREITGIPKMEYWVQMQLQMAVCELNECDFLETRFTEYETKEAFDTDIHKYKGLMILFINENGKPIYEYAPLAICHNDGEMEAWQEEMMEKNKTSSWMKNIYWKLDQLSCVLVLRNKQWFNSVIPQIKEIWEIIEREKKEGYSHREPKKSNPRGKKTYINNDEIQMKSHCFIDIKTEVL
jgi:putative phage-type endonuclease